jgi:Tfp pilus assembly protein PilN
MPADNLSNVNLLGHDLIEESPIGRLVNWATTYGRYIMVLTEVVVLLAFLSRFTLDRKLTDLNEAIEQKKAIIEVNLPFEKEIASLHARIGEVNNIINRQKETNELLTMIRQILPADVYLKKFEITSDSVLLEAAAGSANGFGLLIKNLQNEKSFSGINMTELKKSSTEGILFSLNITRTKKAIVSNPENTKPEKQNPDDNKPL